MSLTRLTPLALLLCVACSPIAVSPALRTIPLETAATAREGHVAIRPGGGVHTSGWGSELAVGSAGVGVGVAEDVELQLDGTLAYDDGLSQRTLSPFIGAGRVGVKHRPLEWLAFTGGVGGGAGPWGTYVGGDLGIIVAYENPYAVPFLATRMQLSLPVHTFTESFAEANGTFTQLTPNPTFWFQPSTGVRIPLCAQDACDGVRVSLTIAVAWTIITQVNAPHDGNGVGIEGGLTIEP